MYYNTYYIYLLETIDVDSESSYDNIPALKFKISFINRKSYFIYQIK